MPSVEISRVALLQSKLAMPFVPLVAGADVVDDVVGVAVAVVDTGVAEDSPLH